MARSEMYRIGARDLLGLATLDETLDGITLLADVALRVATDRLRALLARESGDAVDENGRPLPFVVLGLGKLGGQDLNYSSDVDLAYYYARDAALPAGIPHASSSAGWPRRSRARSAIRPPTVKCSASIYACAPRASTGRWSTRWRTRSSTTKGGATPGSAARSSRRGRSPAILRSATPLPRRDSALRVTGATSTTRRSKTCARMKDRIDAEQSVRRMRSGGVRNVKLGARRHPRARVRRADASAHPRRARPIPCACAGRWRLSTRSSAAGMIAGRRGRGLARGLPFLRNVEHAVQVEEQAADADASRASPRTCARSRAASAMAPAGAARR